jgi:hypothetical protein
MRPPFRNFKTPRPIPRLPCGLISCVSDVRLPVGMTTAPPECSASLPWQPCPWQRDLVPPIAELERFVSRPQKYQRVFFKKWMISCAPLCHSWDLYQTRIPLTACYNHNNRPFSTACLCHCLVRSPGAKVPNDGLWNQDLRLGLRSFDTARCHSRRPHTPENTLN